MACRFHHVALTVNCFNETVQFYKDVLGLTEKISWTMDDGSKAAMLKMPDPCEGVEGGIIEIFGSGTGDEETNPRWTHFAVMVDDVDATYKKALECGAKPSREPVTITIPSNPPSVVRIAFVNGLGGELLEFFSYA